MIKTLIMLTLIAGFGFLSSTALAEGFELSDDQARMALQQIVAHRTFRARPEDKKEISVLLSPDNLEALAAGRKQYTSPNGNCRRIRSSSIFECSIDYTYQVPGDRDLTSHPVTKITFTALVGLGDEISVLEVKEYSKTN